VSAVLRARGVGVTISGTEIISGCDLVVDAGEQVAMVGPNGAGKSTFVRAAAGLQKYAAGEVECMGEPLSDLRGRKLARMRAFVPQRPRVPEGMRVIEAVRIGRAPHLKPFSRPTSADRDAADRSLERAGVAQFRDRMMTTLSGGEMQRVQIAIALAQEAPLLIADEPTSHLDLGATVEIARILRGLADEGLSVLLVVHDLALAAAVADRVVVMAGGRSVAAGEPGEVLEPGRLREVWGVDAQLHEDAGGHTALRVAWLGKGEAS
jgi:iron complex transport system ATP-binding protein